MPDIYRRFIDAGYRRLLTQSTKSDYLSKKKYKTLDDHYRSLEMDAIDEETSIFLMRKWLEQEQERKQQEQKRKQERKQRERERKQREKKERTTKTLSKKKRQNIVL